MPIKYMRECTPEACGRECTHFYVENGIRRIVCATDASQRKARFQVYLLDQQDPTVKRILAVEEDSGSRE